MQFELVQDPTKLSQPKKDHIKGDSWRVRSHRKSCAILKDSDCRNSDCHNSSSRFICRGHTLRHTFGTLMKANGEDMKTIQELLRHSNYKVTADTYTQAVTPTKRGGQTKLGRKVLA